MQPAHNMNLQRRMPQFPAFEVASGYEDALQPIDEIGPHDTCRPQNDPGTAAQRQDGEGNFEFQLDALITLIGGQGLLREVLYKTLAHCAQPRRLDDLESFVSSQNEYVYQHVLQTPYAAIHMLVDCAGLLKTPCDTRGEALTAQRVAGLSKDEVDDLTESYLLQTTSVGLAAVKILDPERRIAAQLAKKPHRRATYLAVLEHCAQEPRSLLQIQQLFADNPDLALDKVTAYHTLAPDYYIDRLEKAGALTWRGAWEVTEAGRRLLASLN